MIDCATPAAIDRLTWFENIRDSMHIEGPYCFVLEEAIRFPEPVPYRGRQGLFNVPDEIVAEQLAKANPKSLAPSP
jgi:hypothetical protein